MLAEHSSEASLSHSSHYSAPTQDPTAMDSLLLTIPEERMGDMGISSIQTPETAGVDGMLDIETPSADDSASLHPEMAPVCTHESLQHAVPSNSASEVSSEPLSKSDSYSSDASDLQQRAILEGSLCDSSGPGSPVITTGYSSPHSFAELALTKVSEVCAHISVRTLESIR